MTKMRSQPTTWALLIGSLLGMALVRDPVLGQQLQVPENLREVGFDQRLGELLPLQSSFQDSTGKTRPLADFFGAKPVVLAMVYFECPMLCTMVLNGVLASLRTLDFTVGEEFDVVVVSFDPREGPDLAAAKKSAYLDEDVMEAAALAAYFSKARADAHVDVMVTERRNVSKVMREIGKTVGHGSKPISHELHRTAMAPTPWRGAQAGGGQKDRASRGARVFAPQKSRGVARRSGVLYIMHLAHFGLPYRGARRLIAT